MIRLGVLLCWLLVLTTPAQAATYYIRTAGGTTAQCTGLTNANYPGSGTGQACAYSNLQDGLTATTYGDTVKLAAGQTFSTSGAFVSFALANKGTPPTGTDADYITITTDDPSGTPSALSGYPNTQTRITTAMAANMPTVRGIGSVPVFSFSNGAKYWKLERLNITNQDTGVQLIALVGQDDPAALADYPDRVVFQYNWLHPIEEVGTPMDASNVERTAENSLYLNATHLTIQNNAFQGFAGLRKYGGGPITSSNLLITQYVDTVVIQNNLLEAWTYAIFTGGSSVPDWLVTKGGTVSGCAPTSCVFSNTTGLSPGDPVSVLMSSATPEQCAGTALGHCWGAAFVSTIVGTTVTFVDPLCHSFDGNNTCTAVGVLPTNGDASRWDGLQPSNMSVRRNIFAHYPEWTALIDGINCGGKGYLEVKACVNCVFDGNVFTGCSGLTVTVRNQGADFVWVSLTGLTFSNNYFKNSNNTFVGFLRDSSPTRKSSNVSWTNNLMVGLAPTLNEFFPGGQMAGYFGGGDSVTVSHNTVLWANPNATGTPGPQYNNYHGFISFATNTMTALTMQNNIFGAGPNFCFTDTAGTSTVPMTTCWPSGVVNHNVIINTDGWDAPDVVSWWPFSGQTFLTSIASVGFTSAPAALDDTGNYRLTSGSAYHNAGSDGTDIGVNYAALAVALGFDPNGSVAPGLSGPASLSGRSTLQ